MNLNKNQKAIISTLKRIVSSWETDDYVIWASMKEHISEECTKLVLEGHIHHMDLPYLIDSMEDVLHIVKETEEEI